MKNIFIFSLTIAVVIGELVFLNPGYAQEFENKSLDELIQIALENNQGIKSAYQKWQASQESIRAEGGLPDPMISYAYFGKNVETRVGPQENKYGLSQKIPFPGKLSLIRQRQQKEAQILEKKYEVARQQLMTDVKLAYYDLYLIERSLESTLEDKSVIEQMEEVTRKKYETRKASQHDVIKVQLELNALTDRIINLRQNQNSALAKLTRLSGIEQPIKISISVFKELPQLKYDEAELYKMAQESRQELQIAALRKEKAEFETSLAKFSYAPDLTLGFDYIQVGSGHTNSPNDGEDAWIGSIAFNVPLWGAKTNSYIRSKKNSFDAEKAAVHDTQDMLRFEIEDLYFKITSYKETIDLYNAAIIPQSEQALQIASSGYETEKIQFSDWLEAQSTLLKAKLAYHRAVVDYLKSLSLLERITGRQIFSLWKRG